MSLVRFATAEAVFETFPELLQKIGAKPNERSPIDFLRSMINAGKLEDAVTFCAYLLPRREAVWWACRSARSTPGQIGKERAPALLAAEAWVSDPDDKHRQAALEAGTKGHCDDPLTWAALAAGWAGGFLVSSPYPSIPMPHYMTARGVRTAILISALSAHWEQRPAYLQARIAEGVRLAEGGA
jgi:hypothetical protein